jgi:prepilin-type N-terminal cleavage/methylation domain-containing protein
MNLRNFKDYRNNHREDGFTFMEVIVAMAIMSLIGVSMWLGFTAAVKLIHRIPESTQMMQEFLGLDNMLREHVSRISIPFWEPQLDYYIDSSAAQFPFYEGIKTKYLLVEFYESELIMRTFEEESEDEPEVIYRSGPYTYVSFTEVEEKSVGILGFEVTLKPEHENVEEFSIFARLGGYPFQKP